MRIERLDLQLLRYRLDKPVGGSGVASVDVLVADAIVSDGAASDTVTGLGMSYVLSGSGAPALAAGRDMAARLHGQPLHHPEAAWRALAATLNRTRRGPNFVALAAIDVALWDAYARARGVPLGVAMGGTPARRIPVYGSGGFSPAHAPGQAAEVARAQVAAGFRGVKPRVSGSRADEAMLRAVMDVLPANCELMFDANEKAGATSAPRLLAMARELRALFVEEPLPADDIAGHRALAHAYPGLVATGEHLQGLAESLPFLSERLCGLFQPDLAAMGGLTECLRVARIAEAFGIEVSPHFLPGLFVHLAMAAPNLSWLEDFPLVEPLFVGWPVMENGTLGIADTPGHGLALAPGVRERYVFEG